jgi:3-oxoacyl-[acyl-carrier protein] reductase
MFNLDGMSALVTGATGGIGMAIVKKLSKAGANVIATGTNQKKLDDLMQSIDTDTNTKISTIQCDLSNRTEVECLFDKAEEIINGEVDIMVCNAGICKDSLAMRMKDEDWDSVLNVNLSSTFFLNRAAIKKMMKRRYGRIINLTSIVGITGNIGQANYTASKAGIIGLSKSLALETASRGITINCIAPGFIESPMTEVLNQDIKSAIMNKIPMSRMGTSEEIANSVLFLAAKESSYITGQTLHVNGGMVMV